MDREAARTFADLVARAYYRGESAKLMKNGRPVARIVPMGEGDRPRSGAEPASLWNEPKRIRLSPAELSDFEADLNETRKSLPIAKAKPWV